MSEHKQEESKKKNILQKHPVVFLLLGALLISILWGVMKSNKVERQLTSEFTEQIELLHNRYNTQLIQAFSLAVRSELIRNNKEQAEQYMLTMVRDENISKVKLIEPKTNKVLFSTDRNEEGKTEKDEFIISVNKPTAQKQGDSWMTATPIMDMTKQMGILVLYVGN